MFKSILFVCVGNICRSPMAQYWVCDQLQKKELSHIQVSSAGIRAVIASPVAQEVHDILTRFHIDSSQHRAQQLNKKIINQAELILTMETWQKQELSFAFPDSRGKIFTLGKWRGEEIQDPYQQSHAVFEKAFDLMRENWIIWQSKIWSL